MQIFNTQLLQSQKLQRRQSLNILIIIQNKFLNFQQTRPTQRTNIRQPTIRQIQPHNLCIIKLGKDC